MSPAKAATKKQKALTIEFSGICTLVWDQKAGKGEVRLVDMSSAGFQQHYAALGIAVTEASPPAVKGPDADAAISVPGEDKDIGVWNLLGTSTEIIGGVGKLTVIDDKVDVTKKPGKNAESIRWLADIGDLCESQRLSGTCPTAATVSLSAGRISAAGGADAKRLAFVADGVPVGPERYCTPRFKAEIPFDGELAIRLDRARVLRFTDSRTIVVSNTCLCGIGVGPTANHFYGHYDVVDAKRRPIARRAGPQPKLPSWPEICFGGFVKV
jgi:hypothetical protein